MVSHIVERARAGEILGHTSGIQCRGVIYGYNASLVTSHKKTTHSHWRLILKEPPDKPAPASRGITLDGAISLYSRQPLTLKGHNEAIDSTPNRLHMVEAKDLTESRGGRSFNLQRAHMHIKNVITCGW